MDLLSKSELIVTDDLRSSNPNSEYQFQFSYLGYGVFYVKSVGYIDDESFEDQLAAGDIARERLQGLNSQFLYHLLWDISELKDISLPTRRYIFKKIKQTSEINRIGFIGASLKAVTIVKILGALIPRLRFSFYRSYDEAIKKTEALLLSPKSNLSKQISTPRTIDYYGRFIQLWQQNPQFINVNGVNYKTVSLPEWQYEAPDKGFKVDICVVEGSIVYSTCRGRLSAVDLEASYGKLDVIIDEFGFNEENKLYSLLDLHKVTTLSLGARKILVKLEGRVRPLQNKAVLLPSPIVRYIFRIIRSLVSTAFAKWQLSDSVEDAFVVLMKHREGYNISRDKESTDFVPDKLVIPASKPEMTDLIIKLFDENQKLKSSQNTNIKKVTEIMGRITWDETFDPTTLTINSTSPFSEIYYSLSLLYSDFQEIINDKMLHMQRLFESEDKYKNLINLASDIILVYQNDSIKFVNPRVNQILDYQISDVVGKPMELFLIKDDANRMKEYNNLRMAGESVPWVYEASLIHRNGTIVPVSLSVGRIIYENQPATLAIAHDISNRKSAEKELEQYRNHLEDIIKERTLQLQKEISEKKEAQESDRLKSAFLSNMSHEIRTPMNAIIAFTDYLKDHNISPEQREEYISYIQSSGESLLNLINDIIDISKIEAQQLNIHKDNFSVNSLLSELLKYYSQILSNSKKENLEIRLSIPPSATDTVLYSDKNRIKQILSNLLDNAVKFTDTGYIEFGYTLEAKSIVFFVNDTGLGIPKDKQLHIFKRFGKIDAGGRNKSGTGLGLTITEQLTQLLHGTITLDSDSGTGARFLLRFPFVALNKKFEEPVVRPVVKQSVYDWKGRKVLIAEDEEMNFKVLEVIIRKTGAEVIRAFDGEEAVQLFKDIQDIDMVLMDIQMPKMDGYEAINLIKNLKPEIPVIAQTAFALLDEQKKCLSLGFNDYISKPIRSEELFDKISVWFD